MPKKLIEVALPLEAINIASAKEKSIRHGHPSTLHLWWARRPLAACRAVLFASLVDDPSSRTDLFPTEKEQDVERQRLFGIIERLVRWENSNNVEVLREARAEILKSTNGFPPPVLDPFCGGGSIPLEAQRLGLEAHASDLNPVAVLINKALIEIPPKFAGKAPINPQARQGLAHSSSWQGATGLAEDVRYYGQWMRDEAEQRIGHLYPQAKLPDGNVANVIAWIWARTVRCPNPACGCQMPLIRSFALSSKSGKQAWVEPIVDQTAKTITFTVKNGTGKSREATVGKRGAICLCCNTPVSLDHIRAEGKAKRMGAQLMAIAAEGKGGRIFLSPTKEHEAIAFSTVPRWRPETELAPNSRHMTPTVYGMTTHAELFTSRQLLALSTFTDLVGEARVKIEDDIHLISSLEHEDDNVQAKLLAAKEYSAAVVTYLALAVSKLSDTGNALVSWKPSMVQVIHLFTRQAIPMVWDFAEPNMFGRSAGDFGITLGNLLRALKETPARGSGKVVQETADVSTTKSLGFLFSTDPPYYDNVPYADLSDFFYVWLRRSLSSIYPELFGTMLVPKVQELVADPFRHNGHEASRKFFEEGMKSVFDSMRKSANSDYPLTIFYAFKQIEEIDSEEPDERAHINDVQMLVEAEQIVDFSVDTTANILLRTMPPLDTLIQSAGRTHRASTGWETMLQGLMEAGFQITGTWPMRTELGNRMRGLGSNALASSIVLVCRPRPESAVVATRREFVNALRRELEDALLKMMHGNIAPVDLAQATIGPGMAVYSRYKQVVEADGTPVRVRQALQIINQELDTVLAATEGDYDTDTRFCLSWFEQFGMTSGAFGDADNMARAKNTSVAGMEESGVLEAKAGKVRLLKREEYPADWHPRVDARLPVWECAQQLVRALMEHGEGAAARLCHALDDKAEPSRDLAYRLYSICERKGWAQEALAYNSLVISWPEITRMASSPNIAMPHTGLFAGEEF